MQENLPEVPTVDQIHKFPWAAISKFQLGLILFLIIYILNTKGGLSNDERKDYQLQVSQANERTFKALEERIKYNNYVERSEKENNLLKDSLQMIKQKVGMGLLPPAKQILKDEK